MVDDSAEASSLPRRILSRLLQPVKLLLIILYVFATSAFDPADPEVAAAGTASAGVVRDGLGDPELLPSVPNRFTTTNIVDYSPTEFEHLVAHLYELQGYDCGLTAETGDQGADVIAWNERDSVAIQVKRYAPGKAAGSLAVRDADAAKSFYNTNRAAAVTSSTFSRGAKAFAEVTGVELIEGEELVDELNVHVGRRQAREPTCDDN